jgi:RNA polymerase sigma factor (sigma-70 family)
MWPPLCLRGERPIRHADSDVNSHKQFGQVWVKDALARQWGGPTTLSDAQLITSSCSEPERFGAIFDRHFDAIYRYCACRVGADLADDLASAIFSVAFRRRFSYDDTREDARPWLYGIATNLLRRHHRTEQRRLRAYARSTLSAEDFDAAGVIARVDAEAQTTAVAAALAQLKPADRDVLLLFAGADQSYQDIADAIGIPIGTVRSRLNRARRIVRERLAVCGQYQDESSRLCKPHEEAL